MDTLNINKSKLTQKMGEAFANLVNRSSKDDWKSEMKSGFNGCYEKIVDTLWKEGAIHVGAIQIDVLDTLDRNLQLFGLVVSAGIQSGILQLSEDNILSIVGDERVFQKNIRLPMMKPRKKYNRFPLGIRDVESILESIPLYFDEEFTIPFSEDVNLFSYTLGVNKGITLCNRELHIPCLHDFRGRMYAKTDVGNYTSDKVQRVHMLVEGMETCALDTRSSCILLTSLITKDNKALKGVFTLGSKTHKVDAYSKVFKHYPQEMIRDNQKKCVMQYTYGGEAILKELCGPLTAKFKECYHKALPYAYIFREACVNGWNPEAEAYGWFLPDGFEVLMENTRTLYELGMKTKYIEIRVSPEARLRKVHPNWSLVAPIPKGKSGSRGLGANLIHSVDAYIMRELVRRCHGQFKVSLEDVRVGKACTFQNPEARKIYEMYTKTNMVSVNILNAMEKGDTITQEYYDDIKFIVDTLPKVGFYIKPIHDEFCCRVEFKEIMREQFNHLLGEVYCSTLGEYFMEECEIQFTVGNSKKDMLEAILNNDYLLHED